MSIDKSTLISGVASYIQKEIVPKISETTPKVVLTAALKVAKRKPEMLEKFASKIEILGVVLSLVDGTDIDIDVVLDSLKEAMMEEGSITVSIPMLKGDLEFAPVDIDILRGYLVPNTTVKEGIINAE